MVKVIGHSSRLGLGLGCRLRLEAVFWRMRLGRAARMRSALVQVYAFIFFKAMAATKLRVQRIVLSGHTARHDGLAFC